MATQTQVNGKTVFITPTGFRIGSKGKVIAPGAFYATLNKGTRRKLRKTARSNGFSAHASAPSAIAA